jgi:hypothetical protein
MSHRGLTMPDQGIQIFKPENGFLYTLFHKTSISINFMGFFDKSGQNGFTIDLAGLLIVIVVGLASAYFTERLAGEKPGKNIISVILITLLGSYIVAGARLISFDPIVEGIPVVSALLGALIFGVFYVLIRRQFRPKSKSSGA